MRKTFKELKKGIYKNGDYIIGNKVYNCGGYEVVKNISDEEYDKETQKYFSKSLLHFGFILIITTIALILI